MRPLRCLLLGIAVAGGAQFAAVATASADGPSAAAVQLVRTTTRPNGAIVLTVTVAEPGQLTAVALYGPGADRAGVARAGARLRLPKPYGAAAAEPGAPGVVKLHVRPTHAARVVLRRRHRLRVYLTVVLLPAHGGVVTLRTRALVRITSRARARRHRAASG